MLTKLSLNIKEPSETLFDEYFQLCTSIAVQESARLKRTCYLTFSALVGKECVQRFKATPKHTHSHHRKEHKVSDNSKHHCNPEVAGKYYKLLISQEFGPEITTKDTILLLKTIGNLKPKEAIPFLKAYIRSSHTHYIRSTAIWKLMGMASNYPEEVRSVCVPVFYNRSEEQDLRIAGLLGWLSSGPSFAQLHLIAKQLLIEDNRQIVNMAYTSIKWLSESEHPCHKPFVKDLQSVLWLYKIAFDRQGGRQYGIGGIQHLSIIASNRSYVPNSVYITFSDFIAGQSFETFSLTIQSYGLEKLIDRFFGKKGVVWGKNSVFDVFKKRTVRDTNPVDDELKLIDENMHFENRESEIIIGDISLYSQGYTIAYIDFDEQLFSYFTQSENRIVVLRSEVGIPYFFEYKTLTQTNLISNKLSFGVQPALFSQDRDNRPPTELRLNTDFKYVSNSHKYAITGILLPVTTTKEKSYLKDYFGFGLSIDGSVRKTDKSEWFRLFTEKSWPQRITLYRMQPMANPYEMRVRTTALAENASTQLSITISSDHNMSDISDLIAFSADEDSHFKDYTSLKQKRAKNHSLNVKISSLGSIERTVNARIQYMYSRDRLLHKVNVYYDRSPANDNGFKVCAVASMMFPGYDLNKFVKLDTFDLDHTVNTTTRIAFGQNCNNRSKINFMAQLSQTDEQKMFEKNRDKVNDEKPNPYANNYNYCLNSFKFKYDSFPYCHRYLYPITQMRKLVFSIDYENISHKVANNTQKLWQFLSRKQSVYSDMSFRYGNATPGHIDFESNTSVSTQKVDYKLTAPYYTQHYKDVPLPQYLMPVFTFPLHDLQYHRVLRKVVKNPNIVQTFDNVSYSLPNIDSECFAVVSKDCSDEHNFLILAKRHNERSEIKVYLGHKYKIELIPAEQGLTVRVNGEKVVVTETDPFELNAKIGDKDIELFVITYNGLYYELNSEEYGISVGTDGYGFRTGAQRYYSGKLCGLCGDNNGDATHEYRASNGRVFLNSDPFSYSYVLKDDNCVPSNDWQTDNQII
ncbi:unnamed protein product [Medioppia subpectinata]|uniref:VWFD domain-containing protein n=1 Tax=Medioppia subpectinata TaxID=1979941 RepID=A0A7R9Q2P2_9ACAR|nr:unnamed protein product [Medioppia subpectinata]CAG2110598.1 unnamed protein product [Medioppia subpectinata]